MIHKNKYIEYKYIFTLFFTYESIKISFIPDLTKEIHAIEKEVLLEKTRVKALEDELGIKMNIHR